MATTATVCQIPQGCMLEVRGATEPSCNPEDLGCICESSNSLEHNLLFDAHCLFKECTQEVGRGEFLRDLTVACEKRERKLIEIPTAWQAYLPFPAMTTQGPAAYAPTSATATLGVTSSTMHLMTMSTLSTSTSSPPPSSPSSAPLPAQTITKTTTRGLSPGIIGGICVSVMIPVVVLVVLAYLYYKSRQTTKVKLAENARLRDQCSTEGFSQRIREILGEDETPPRSRGVGFPHGENRSSSVYSRN